MIEKMKLGKIEFGYIWERISEQAKDLVKNCLQFDSNRRFNADQALKHCWFNVENMLK